MNTKKRAAPGPASRTPTGKQRDGKGRFIKGISGNPLGVKQMTPEVKQFCREKSMKWLLKVDALGDKVDTPGKDLIAIARLFLEYGYGRPAAELDRERLDVDIRRLQMDERKAELEQKDASGDSTIRIVLSDEVKDLIG